jgi:hypothetical protein
MLAPVDPKAEPLCRRALALRGNALVQGTWRWRQPWKLCVRVSREEYSGETRLTPGQIAPYFARGDTNVFYWALFELQVENFYIGLAGKGITRAC